MVSEPSDQSSSVISTCQPAEVPLESATSTQPKLLLLLFWLKNEKLAPLKVAVELAVTLNDPPVIVKDNSVSSVRAALTSSRAGIKTTILG